MIIVETIIPKSPNIEINKLVAKAEAKIFIKTRVNLDLASFKEDIWSH